MKKLSNKIITYVSVFVLLIIFNLIIDKLAYNGGDVFDASTRGMLSFFGILLDPFTFLFFVFALVNIGSDFFSVFRKKDIKNIINKDNVINKESSVFKDLFQILAIIFIWVIFGFIFIWIGIGLYAGFGGEKIDNFISQTFFIVLFLSIVAALGKDYFTRKNSHLNSNTKGLGMGMTLVLIIFAVLILFSLIRF